MIFILPVLLWMALLTGVALPYLLVAAYFCYTLLDWRWLAPLVDPTVRTVLFGIVLAPNAFWLWLVFPPMSLIVLLPPVVVVAAVVYATLRQWLIPRPAALLVATKDAPDEAALVAVLATGDAVAVRWLERPRTAVTGPLCVVHCGLSRSLMAVSIDPSARPKAWLPHASGFSVRDRSGTWDGVDGAAVAVNPPAQRDSVGLCTARAWRTAHPTGQLLRPMPFKLPRPSRLVLVKGARGVTDAMDWGVVEAGVWRELNEADFDVCPDVSDTAATRYYLARWAAIVRGLPGAASQDGNG